MAFKKQPLEKTHDLGYLAVVCGEYDLEFKNYIDDAEKLNSYSIFFRYPNVDMAPEEQQVHEAIGIAERLLQFVEQKINGEKEKQHPV